MTVATLEATVTHIHGLPVIDPQSLSRAQRSGERCAIPNCRRLLADFGYQIGRLPGGKPVLACPDCAPGVRLDAVA